MTNTRKSGILLHPTSLPGPYGIGTLGKQAYRFLDWLHAANQTLWQILPLGPTGYGDSPYASFSTFAGNPLLVDLELLVTQNLLAAEDIIPPEYIQPDGPVDFGSVTWWKIPLLHKAASNLISGTIPQEYTTFLDNNAWWLDDYALFMSIKNYYDQKAREEKLDGRLWNNYWPSNLATRDPASLSEWKQSHQQEIDEYKGIQYLFFSQWHAVKDYANKLGIRVIGDIPIFVAADSSDVWANQSLFQLTPDGTPTVVAGVPPDYFSETGQLWGNPLYDWAAMKKHSYEWWKKRIQATLAMVDIVRVDHFRGFEAYWAVPAGDTTAVNGEWIPGPDHDFFTSIRNSLGDIPLLAEDLGVITPEVARLRDDFNFPGMKVLQFAFDANEAGKSGLTNSFLPHMYTNHCIVYTGTHDNATMQEWIDDASEEERMMVMDYLGRAGEPDKLVEELIRLAFSSVADYAVIPLQDIYAIGREGRMNTPSTLGGNWCWRMNDSHFSAEKAGWLRKLSHLYARNLGDTP